MNSMGDHPVYRRGIDSQDSNVRFIKLRNANNRPQLLNLPYVIFLEILTLLPAVDALRCRCLSRDVHALLTSRELCVSLILYHFPRSREGRRLRQIRQGTTSNDDSGDEGKPGGGEPGRREEEEEDWSAVFALLTRRYFHLSRAMPWRVDKVRAARNDVRQFFAVAPWDSHLLLGDRAAPLHHWDPNWTYAAPLGLLVYPECDEEADTGWWWQLRDVETGLDVEVPFHMCGKILRRVRLSGDGVLVFEWCEREPFLSLTDRSTVHQHFVTAYDVKRVPLHSWSCSNTSTSSRGLTHTWSVTLRSEWKIHSVGLPVTDRDRFFSAHNATHYAIYVWQPDRSPESEDGPLEALVVWDISRPSVDRIPGDANLSTGEGESPRIILSLVNWQLDAWGARQGEAPSLRGLELDAVTVDAHTGAACGHVFMHHEKHRWAVGLQAGEEQPRLHSVRVMGIPLIGAGPQWVDDCGGGGGDSTSFCWRGPRTRGHGNVGVEGNDGQGEKEEEDEAVRDEKESWAGRASCWRHDDFPYLTVSEVFDAAAGVRISARQCFMLETLSVHVRPRLRVTGHESGRRSSSRMRRASGDNLLLDAIGSGYSSDESDWELSREGEGEEEEIDEGNSDDGEWWPEGAGTRIEGPSGEEVQFGDEMWDELLGKGVLYGDERRIVGQDEQGQVTIVHF